MEWRDSSSGGAFVRVEWLRVEWRDSSSGGAFVRVEWLRVEWRDSSSGGSFVPVEWREEEASFFEWRGVSRRAFVRVERRVSFSGRGVVYAAH